MNQPKILNNSTNSLTPANGLVVRTKNLPSHNIGYTQQLSSSNGFKNHKITTINKKHSTRFWLIIGMVILLFLAGLGIAGWQVFKFFNEHTIIDKNPIGPDLPEITDWKQEGTNLDNLVALAKSTSDDIYAASGKDVWRFNGDGWEQVGTNSNDIRGIHSLLTTTAGDIYVGTQLNGNQDKIWKLQGSDWVQVGTSKFSVLSFLETSTGGIYVGAGGQVGVWKLQGSDWVQVGNNGLTVLSLLETASGDIYAGTYTGVLKYNGTDWVQVGTNLNQYAINSLLETSTGDVYAGTSKNGVWKLNRSDWEQVGTKLKDNNISSLLETSTGEIYVGAYQEGVWKLADNDWVKIGVNLNSYSINSLLATASGSIYAGTQMNGIWKGI